MEFILRSVIQSIRAQDVAGRVEPKNASLKQLNFMLCTQLSLGLAETSSFHGFWDSCCSNELLVQPRGRRRAALWPERGAGGAQRGARLILGSSTGLYGWCSVVARALLSEESFLVLQEAGACLDTQHPPPEPSPTGCPCHQGVTHEVWGRLRGRRAWSQPTKR